MKRFALAAALCLLLPGSAHAVCGFGSLVSGSCVGFVDQGTTSWTVPADFTSVNTFETIAGGGGGTSGGPCPGGGGGGGAYSKVANLTLTLGSSPTLQVGAGGAINTNGTDSWFNGASLGASSVGSKAGNTGSGATAGLGGLASGGVGTTKYSGGDGGGGVCQYGGGGGGGAAGPGGGGGVGGNQGNNSAFSGGGGGNGGGGNANNANGNGGAAVDGTAGGLAGNPCTNGSHGSGGGAGSGGMVNGCNGGNGVDWDATHGSGGGGGGASSAGGNPGAGGNAGNYGGGGAGSAWLAGTNKPGANGELRITYTPAAAGAGQEMMMGVGN